MALERLSSVIKLRPLTRRTGVSRTKVRGRSFGLSITLRGGGGSLWRLEALTSAGSCGLRGSAHSTAAQHGLTAQRAGAGGLVLVLVLVQSQSQPVNQSDTCFYLQEVDSFRRHCSAFGGVNEATPPKQHQRHVGNPVANLIHANNNSIRRRWLTSC